VPKRLSVEQKLTYDNEGILFPLGVLSASEVAIYRNHYLDLEDRLGGDPRAMSQCQLHFRWAYDMAAHPAILDIIEDLIGPDILVHSTTFFTKLPRDACYVSWHQDGHYLGLSAPCYASAWVALTASDPQNGCMRVVPGSHRQGKQPHGATALSDRNLLSSGLEIAVEVDESEVTDVVLEPGEISLHHVDIVHGSNPNLSDRRRIGYAIRYVAPHVRQTSRHHPVMLARGKDEYGYFDTRQDPPGDSIEEGMAAQLEFRHWLAKLRVEQGRKG
jgi:ectoine hydroxylase-related dioxygenase (phytanoyl-CoA dioxygenase family)